jgi:hypothetical protein
MIQEHMRQGGVAVLVGVDIGVGAFVVVLLHQFRAVPDKHRPLRLGGFQAAFVDVFFSGSL